MLRNLTFLIIRLMGIKKIFSKNPVDYKKLRKSDRKLPPKSLSKKFLVESLDLDDNKVYKIKKPNTTSKDLIIFIHGGAFISGPAEHHWNAIEKIVKHTGKELWLIDYPKAPEYNIHQICQNIDWVYEFATQTLALSENITLIGDSVGGNLIMTLTQRLLEKKKEIPKQLILITPVFDASMSNPEIESIAEKDPMLNVSGILSAKEMCANGLDLKDKIISPLYGTFKGFPKTEIYIGAYDIMYPDAKIGVQKMQEEEVDVKLIDGAKMPHIYPLLPVLPQAKKALQQIIESIKE
ncbi:alpha/beta hydrolase fold domain-containing protein [uncultured Tenacibaculum sp.]|uniref:alpha/beta hydrolase fold domain-containing protein n=1 Tax=uncultured Tenacibaculum sp. TaxID=174713 RepID=UPI00261ABB23|nr:alpha/beta hydrolase [uncultured Tenacibaculum sp.]